MAKTTQKNKLEKHKMNCEFGSPSFFLTSTTVMMQLLLWLGITLVSITPHAVGEVPTPEPWPSPFYALLYQNLSGTIGFLDLWYDWENGRNLHLIRDQYQPVTHDMLWQNGTVLRWEVGSKCRVYDAGVGLLPPNWLGGATYVGTQEEDGFTVNVWTKLDFITYREDILSKRPVSWTFYTGRDVHVITWQPGTILVEENWNVPEDCFLDKEKVDSSASVFHKLSSPTSDFGDWMVSGSMSV